MAMNEGFMTTSTENDVLLYMCALTEVKLKGGLIYVQVLTFYAPFPRGPYFV